MEETMAQRTTTHRWTYEEYLHFPDDGRRWQIIDGERHLIPAPRVLHQRVIGRFHLLLAGDPRVTALGEVLLSPVDLVLSPTDVVQPDLLFVSRERASIVREKALHGAPDLVIEVLSPSTEKLDRVLKRGLYEESRVGELWLVDVDAGTVEVHRREEAGFGEPETLPADGTLTSPALPGIALPLARIFRDVA